jgi:hypothetical protein
MLFCSKFDEFNEPSSAVTPDDSTKFNRSINSTSKAEADANFCASGASTGLQHPHQEILNEIEDYFSSPVRTGKRKSEHRRGNSSSSSSTGPSPAKRVATPKKNPALKPNIIPHREKAKLAPPDTIQNAITLPPAEISASDRKAAITVFVDNAPAKPKVCSES